MNKYALVSTRWRMVLYRLPLLLLATLLVACSGSTAQVKQQSVPTPTPTLEQGAQLLQKLAQQMNSAKTLHSLLTLTFAGQNINGVMNSEVWHAAPDKNRTVILQSSIQGFPAGSVTVSDGKDIWQYNPVQKIVYTGQVPANTNGGSFSRGQNQAIFRLMQTIFTRSDGTLKSSTANINGQPAYDIYIVPQSSATSRTGSDSLNYSGDIFLDKETQQPIKVKLNLQNYGTVTLDIQKLELNQSLPPDTFTFVAPPGTKELPLQDAGNSNGSLSLDQATQQAGYHLLSIPSSQKEYTLQDINALGAPGNQIYTLTYTIGTSSFTIAQGKPLAGLPVGSGQQVKLRGSTALLSSENGHTTLAWTEQGVGVRITGPLSNTQIVGIAQILS